MTVDDIKRSERIKQEQNQERGKVKPQESEFDQLLKKNQLSANMNPQQSKVSSEQAIREAVKQQEKQGEEKKRDDDDGDRKNSSRQKGERTESRNSDHQRVEGKGGNRQGSEGGGSGGNNNSGGGGARQGSKRDLSKLARKGDESSLPVDLKGKFAQKLSKAIKAEGSNQAESIQRMVDKIVQFVKVGINRNGQDEMQIELSDRIFRGLKLRVFSKGNGKIGISFRVADESNKKALAGTEGAIRKRLKEKGIDVDEFEIS